MNDCFLSIVKHLGYLFYFFIFSGHFSYMYDPVISKSSYSSLNLSKIASATPLTPLLGWGSRAMWRNLRRVVHMVDVRALAAAKYGVKELQNSACGFGGDRLRETIQRF